MTTSPVASITDEQLAEIEALSLEAEAFDWAPDIGMSHSETVYACHVGPSVIRDLIARLRAAEKDAARYRWLRNPAQDVAMVLDKVTGHVPVDSFGAGGYATYEYRAGEELDQAIDTAMEQQP